MGPTVLPSMHRPPWLTIPLAFRTTPLMHSSFVSGSSMPGLAALAFSIHRPRGYLHVVCVDRHGSAGHRYRESATSPGGTPPPSAFTAAETRLGRNREWRRRDGDTPCSNIMRNRGASARLMQSCSPAETDVRPTLREPTRLPPNPRCRHSRRPRDSISVPYSQSAALFLLMTSLLPTPQAVYLVWAVRCYPWAADRAFLCIHLRRIWPSSATGLCTGWDEIIRGTGLARQGLLGQATSGSDIPLLRRIPPPPRILFKTTELVLQHSFFLIDWSVSALRAIYPRQSGSDDGGSAAAGHVGTHSWAPSANAPRCLGKTRRAAATLSLLIHFPLYSDGPKLETRVAADHFLVFIGVYAEQIVMKLRYGVTEAVYSVDCDLRAWERRGELQPAALILTLYSGGPKRRQELAADVILFSWCMDLTGHFLTSGDFIYPKECSYEIGARTDVRSDPCTHFRSLSVMSLITGGTISPDPMPTLNDTPLSTLTSTIPTTNRKILLAITIVCLLVCALQAFAPTRLLDLLISSIESAEKTYFGAMEAGILGDTHAVALASLQIRVSQIRQQTLSNSQSLAVGLREFFKGHSFTILRGIRDARKFETEIELCVAGRPRHP
ncbi:hypothetical protein FB45DRAFT_869075 [Roridomyces roridus]|uniref:Uncharacterized protein n=1 Tax=Roridomyces roridus TaxID=1738132 RepID=A0AAD7BN97_9AGAR|nr:hypothetical protein FB45DRAFT_869075 [Roridomyces roridus]